MEDGIALMKSAPFRCSLGFLVIGGIFALLYQDRQLRSLVPQLQSLTSVSQSTAEPILEPKVVTPPRNADESGAQAELLRLRGEVTLLQKDITSMSRETFSPQQAIEDWAFVHSGPKPSEHPGYIALTNCSAVGFDTPETAVQSFFFAMRNQDKQPLTPTRMKQIWDVPSDFDSPGKGYNIDIGQGYGVEEGYRIVEEKALGSNQISLRLEFQHAEGAVSHRDLILVQNGDSWRLKPVRVSRSGPQQ